MDRLFERNEILVSARLASTILAHAGCTVKVEEIFATEASDQDTREACAARRN